MAMRVGELPIDAAIARNLIDTRPGLLVRAAGEVYDSELAGAVTGHGVIGDARGRLPGMAGMGTRP